MFEVELNYIRNERIRESAKVLIDGLPEYFFRIAASSTGKYHPAFALGERGLVRHTKVAVRIAYELFQIIPYDRLFSSDEKDIMILSLLIHDGIKKGFTEERYTRFDHPNLIADYVELNKGKTRLSEKEIDLVKHVLNSHMGKWNTNPYSKFVLKLPNDKYQYFVHMCDYLASRKFLNVNFNGDNIE